MSTKETKFNPTMALASLMTPHEDRLFAIRMASRGESFGIDGYSKALAPFHWDVKQGSSLFNMLSAGVAETGDSLHIERVSQDRIRVQFENRGEREEDLIDSYGAYVTSMICPTHFARTWNEFLSLMLGTVKVIGGGIAAVLDGKDDLDLDARIEGGPDVKAILGLSPHINALGKFFDVSNAFFRNQLMWRTWEQAFIRGHKHHLGNSLFFMTLLNQYIDSGEIKYGDLKAVHEDASSVLNPFIYMRESFSGDIVGQWVDIEAKGDARWDVGLAHGVRLRRVIDEIIYGAGTAANGSPMRIEVERAMSGSALAFRTDNGAFSPFNDGMPARLHLENLYGGENLQFINGSKTGTDSDLSEIRIIVSREDGETSGGGGNGIGQGGILDGGTLADEQSISAAEYVGAASYATIAAAGGMASIAGMQAMAIPSAL